jgi:hypothetical protein
LSTTATARIPEAYTACSAILRLQGSAAAPRLGF